MAKNGLDATDYRDWISKSIDIDDFTNKLFSEFVVGTPAFSLSKKGRCLYDYYEYKSLDKYKNLKEELIGEIPFLTYEKYEDLKQNLLNDNDINFTNYIPSVLVEKIYIYVGEITDSKFYRAFFKNDTSNKGKKKATIQNEAADKKIAVAIEKLFYHLRNGFAHGCFTIVRQKNEVYYIIQDESNDNCISARIILKSTTLQSWIDCLYQRKQEINMTISINKIIEEKAAS